LHLIEILINIFKTREIFEITSRVKLKLLQMFENDSVKSNPKFRQEAVHVLAIQTVSDLLGHSIHELHHIE